jgi:hypothetical protein
MPPSNLSKQDLHLISVALGIYLEMVVIEEPDYPQTDRIRELQRAFTKASDGDKK